MAFVVSPGATRPAGYSSVGQTGHDADANGHDEFILRLRRFLCGVPEIDNNGVNNGITPVGVHDSAISQIDGKDNGTATGTWNIRRLNGTTLRVTDPAAANTDFTVTWGTAFDINPHGETAVDLTFKIDDTGADQLADTEGWDVVLVANGLPAAEAWHQEGFANEARGDVDWETTLRGRKVSGVTDPTLVPEADKFFVEMQAISDSGLEKFQLRTQWVTTLPDYPGSVYPTTLGSLVRCPMWTEHGVTGARLMSYYIVANHRWCIYVVNVDGNWFGGYFGLFDAFATDTQYPLPFMNGGCTHDEADIYTLQDQDVSWAHMSNNVTGDESNLYFRTPEGTLEVIETQFVNSGGGPGSNTVIFGSTNEHQIWPWGSPAQYTTEAGVGTVFQNQQTSQSVGVASASAKPLRGAVDGTKIFLPATLVETVQGNGAGGNRRHVLSGHIPFVFYTNGFGVSAGDIVTSGGRDFLMVQNVYRSAEQGFWALELA